MLFRESWQVIRSPFIVRLVVRNPCFSIVMVSSLRRLMAGNACLFAKKHKLISSSIANKYYAPLALPDVNIHYVAVPDRQNEYQVDLRELLRL